MSTLAELVTRVEQLEARLAERDRQLAERDARIVELEAKVRELEERLGRNSSNSGRPPSSDSPEARKRRRAKAQKRRKKSGRRRGGQSGHKGHKRQLYPPDQVSESMTCRPESCGSCGNGFDPTQAPVSMRRDQVVEVPPMSAEVTEYQRLRLLCDTCGHTTEGARPAGAPPGAFGPRLTAFAAMLTGGYHLSRRRAVSLLRDAFGVRMSIGALSTCERRMTDALAHSYAEAVGHVREAETRYVDATTWWSQTARTSVWVVATATVTLLAITANATRKALLSVVGRITGRVVCDRATVFNCWNGSNRQTCWAHLLRYFAAMADRGGESGRIGTELCTLTLAMFSAWHDFRRGELTRDELQAALRQPRGDPEPKAFTERVRELLEQGTACGHDETQGTCRNILAQHWSELWTFVDIDGVEPTNNHAERELRPAVLWRKRSFGTQCDRGERFAERMLTAARTLRKQERQLHTFLIGTLHAAWNDAAPPSLLRCDHPTP